MRDMSVILREQLDKAQFRIKHIWIKRDPPVHVFYPKASGNTSFQCTNNIYPCRQDIHKGMVAKSFTTPAPWSHMFCSETPLSDFQCSNKKQVSHLIFSVLCSVQGSAGARPAALRWSCVSATRSRSAQRCRTDTGSWREHGRASRRSRRFPRRPGPRSRSRRGARRSPFQTPPRAPIRSPRRLSRPRELPPVWCQCKLSISFPFFLSLSVIKCRGFLTQKLSFVQGVHIFFAGFANMRHLENLTQTTRLHVFLPDEHIQWNPLFHIVVQNILLTQLCFTATIWARNDTLLPCMADS